MKLIFDDLWDGMLCESCRRVQVEVVVITDSTLFGVCRDCAALATTKGVSIHEAVIHACHR